MKKEEHYFCDGVTVVHRRYPGGEDCGPFDCDNLYLWKDGRVVGHLSLFSNAGEGGFSFDGKDTAGRVEGEPSYGNFANGIHSPWVIENKGWDGVFTTYVIRDDDLVSQLNLSVRSEAELPPLRRAA